MSVSPIGTAVAVAAAVAEEDEEESLDWSIFASGDEEEESYRQAAKAAMKLETVKRNNWRKGFQ